MSNPNTIIVHKNRTNIITIGLGINITGETITSEIRSEPEHTSTLIATWSVTVIDAPTGEIKLTLDNALVSAITHKSGYMDLKRVSVGEPLSVFDTPLEVEFQGTVTA